MLTPTHIRHPILPYNNTTCIHTNTFFVVGLGPIALASLDTDVAHFKKSQEVLWISSGGYRVEIKHSLQLFNLSVLKNTTKESGMLSVHTGNCTHAEFGHYLAPKHGRHGINAAKPARCMCYTFVAMTFRTQATAEPRTLRYQYMQVFWCIHAILYYLLRLGIP